MTTTDYLIDSALILLVLLQIKERPLTIHQLLRPLVIVAIAVASYLHGIPSAGNDLVLAAITILIGATIGVASGQTVIMRRGAGGEALAPAFDHQHRSLDRRTARRGPRQSPRAHRRAGHPLPADRRPDRDPRDRVTTTSRSRSLCGSQAGCPLGDAGGMFRLCAMKATL